MRVIRVRVTAHGRVKKYLEDRLGGTIELKEGASIKDLFHALSKPRDEIWLVNVNGLVVHEEYKLRDGDEVIIFEPVGGG